VGIKENSPRKVFKLDTGWVKQGIPGVRSSMGQSFDIKGHIEN
jgi:hypothetical protein